MHSKIRHAFPPRIDFTIDEEKKYSLNATEIFLMQKKHPFCCANTAAD